MPRSGDAINTLVSIDVLGAEAPQVLVSGNDFYSTPRLALRGWRPISGNPKAPIRARTPDLLCLPVGIIALQAVAPLLG